MKAWRADHLKGGIRYRIETSHPVVAAVLDNAGENRKSMEAMLRIIEETVPVQQIWLDTAESRDTPPRSTSTDAPDSEMKQMMQTFFDNFVLKKGDSEDAAKRRLLNMEPFNRFPTAVGQLKPTRKDNV